MLTEQIRTALQCGEYELKGQFVLGSNYTFLVEVHHEGGSFSAVYKPSRGEHGVFVYLSFEHPFRKTAPLSGSTSAAATTASSTP